MKKKLFNPELNRTAIYTEVWKTERINVKDEKDLLVKNHYWKDSNGQLWGDFDNPMENFYSAMDAYNKRKESRSTTP